MSYIKAETILPKELIEAIQQYVEGKSIYIPSKENRNGAAGPLRKYISVNATRRYTRPIKQAGV